MMPTFGEYIDLVATAGTIIILTWASVHSARRRRKGKRTNAAGDREQR
jgi:hypothetical protein